MKQKSKKLDLNLCLNFCNNVVSLHTIFNELVNISGENRWSRGSTYELLNRAEGQKSRSPRVYKSQEKNTSKQLKYLRVPPQNGGMPNHSSSPVEHKDYDITVTFRVYFLLLIYPYLLLIYPLKRGVNYE